MLSIPGIKDPEMPDETNGFDMALARNNTKVIERLISYNLSQVSTVSKVYTVS